MAKKTTKPTIEAIDLPVNTIQASQTTQYAPLDNATAYNSGYGGFNLGLHVGDDETAVLGNRHYLQNSISNDCKIQWLEQVHSNEVVFVDKLISPYPRADAMITRTTNIILAIMTADCLPILLASKNGDEIAALHCGWRSMSDHIISHTINKMKNNSQDIIAWLGPCISQQYFEVGEEVRKAFLDHAPQLTQFFMINAHFKYQADLFGIAKFLLKASGVNIIFGNEQCTYANEEKYYSYRRNNITGRMASLIFIK